MKLLSILSVLLLIAAHSGAQSSATAPFTGAVTVESYQIDAEGNRARVQQLPLLVSPSRILLVGLHRVDPSAITANLGAEDLLIRLDREDFVFMMRDKQALVIQKNELQALMALTSGLTAPAPAPTDAPAMQVRQTTETRQIHGYTAQKWIATMPGSADENHIWVSDAFGLNLGMLSESWIASLPGIRMLPLQGLIAGGNTPLLVETYRRGRKVAVVELRDFNTRIDRARLDLPSDTRTMTLQEMMLNRMRSY